MFGEAGEGEPTSIGDGQPLADVGPHLVVGDLEDKGQLVFDDPFRPAEGGFIGGGQLFAPEIGRASCRERV